MVEALLNALGRIYLPNASGVDGLSRYSGPAEKRGGLEGMDPRPEACDMACRH